VSIELLYFDGCPNHEALLARLHELLDHVGRTPELVLRRIADDASAQRECFLGSPTVRVDGRDVEPGADERTDYGMKCRLYATPVGLTGMPTDDWLRRALTPTRPFAAMRVRALNRAERALHRRILRAFAAGTTPSASQLDAWARELALDPGKAAATLARHDLVHRDARTGEVTVAYPFSAAPTRHRVRLSSGAEMSAMCAIDALGIAFMLGQPTDVSSTDPGTGEPITISLPLTEPAAWSPHDAVVVAGREGSGMSLSCTCPHTNFAASPGGARALLEAQPAVTGDILSMPTAIEQGRETFGGVLERDVQEVAHADRDPA
jgi:Alkylmercury lyase